MFSGNLLLGQRSTLEYSNGISLAYSLRQLFSNMPVVRVRRSTDNAVADFYSSEISNGSLASFCGGGNGFVTTWYDQSGNGNHASQADTSRQPQIVSNGNLILDGGKPAIQFDGTINRFELQTIINFEFANYTFFVGSRTTSGHPLFGLAGTDYLFGVFTDNKYYLQNRSSGYVVSPADSSTGRLILSAGRNSLGSQSMYKNNTIISGLYSSYPLGTQLSYVGFYPPAVTHARGLIQEVLFYNQDVSAERTGIESNINSYYTVY